METKDVLLELRTKKGLSQDELAEKVYVTRQAVSRWETGETTPNTETLKQLSKLFDVSINTLLGSPRKLICQCCGMPLEDGNISKETDGQFNEAFCKWCYMDGQYTYDNMEDLVDFCVKHMANAHYTPEQVRAHLLELLPQLDYWKRYVAIGGRENLEAFEKQIVNECNELQIPGMPEVKRLHTLEGRTVNFPYRLPNGKTVTFLADDATYLGDEFACLFGGDQRYGIVASMEFLLVYTHEAGSAEAELVLYKHR